LLETMFKEAMRCQTEKSIMSHLDQRAVER